MTVNFMDRTDYFWLALLSAIGESMIGISHAIIFGFPSRIRKRVCCACCLDRGNVLKHAV